ncbi:kynurenine formamidase isoform X2 [Phasianus colchicus]|uniref:kynurenine formamidase isoform X2 n=1 Tax=Phasianus colchicus TaxID=9054 RepID=UPI00129E9A7F|nr:kynurenine formamidase isoform X2 [Phasianus colchicus]
MFAPLLTDRLTDRPTDSQPARAPPGRPIRDSLASTDRRRRPIRAELPRSADQSERRREISHFSPRSRGASRLPGVPRAGLLRHRLDRGVRGLSSRPGPACPGGQWLRARPGPTRPPEANGRGTAPPSAPTRPGRQRQRGRVIEEEMGRWQDMGLEELEKQYSPSRWSRRMDSESVIQAHIDVMTAGTQKAQAAARTSLHVPYGDGDGEKLDIYFPGDSSETFPVFVYIHGGYWQCLRGIYLCGHSAGAHLAAMVLSTDWTEFGVVPDIRGAVLVSGVYDLEPLLHTYVNDALNMSLEVAQRNSPILCITQAVPVAASCEVLVAVAQHDSPEFRRQSQEYSQALRLAGWSVSLLDLASVDHFDIIEKLSEETYVLTQVILNMIARAC